MPTRSRTPTESGRALPFVLIGLAVLALVVLFGTDLLSPADDAGPGDGRGDGTEGLVDVEEGATDGTDGDGAALDLAPLYGEGDRGAIRVRLLRVGSGAPITGQPLDLADRRGLDVATEGTDSTGAAVFRQIAPGRGYSLLIVGEGFKPVTIRGITVHRGETTNLDDIYLGQNIVLRGRVVDSSGKPLPAASVSVFEGRPGISTDGVMFAMARLALSQPSPVEATRTDVDGYFTLSSLDEGVYQLEARHGGFATEVEKDVVVQTDRTAGTLTLVLGEGARLSGKVLTDANKPIEGAQVVAVLDEGRRFQMTGSTQREYTTTAEDGSFILDTLSRDSSYRFGVLADGFAPIFDTNPRKIEGEETREWRLAAGGRIEGIVTDATSGEPIHDAQVAVFVGEFMNRDPSNQASTAVAKTNKEGRFVLEGVPEGPISSAQVMAYGFVTESRSQWTQNQWPDVKAGEVTEVEVQLQAGGVIRGFVRSAEEKQPIQGATVILENQMAFWQGSPSTISNADGAFELVGVRPGEYGVVAVADGFAPSSGEQTRVTMDAAGSTQTIDVDLTAAGVIRGVVFDQAGEPVVGVRVRVEARAEPQPDGATGGQGRGRGRGGRGGMMQRMLSSSRGALDMTDVDGKFELKGVSAGRWVVTGESDEYVKSYSEPFRVSAGEAEETELVMVTGGEIRGRVLDERGGGLAGARVRVGHIDPEQARRMQLSSWEADRNLESDIYTTDESGRFHAPNLEPGLTLVKVEKDGYITYYKRNARIMPGQVLTYMAAMSRGEVIEGVVRSEDEKPIRGASVFATLRENPRTRNEELSAEGEEPEEVEPTLMARSDGSGKFRIENVPPGRYSVLVGFGARGYQTFWQQQSEAAIVRGVEAPAEGVEFRLEKQPEGEGNQGPGRR